MLRYMQRYSQFRSVRRICSAIAISDHWQQKAMQTFQTVCMNHNGTIYRWNIRSFIL